MTDVYFNLVDEPWLPVRMADGSVTELSLLETFKLNQQIKALAEASPLNLVAQYRLLLAILNRALTFAFPGRNIKDEDRAKWFKDGLPTDAVVDYLNNWRERFWLFHPEQPFMQVADLKGLISDKDRKPWTQLDLSRASGNNKLLFDHSIDADPTPITPKNAIRCMLGNLQFAIPGGIKSLSQERTSDVDCALSNTAAFIPIGKNLNQTLALCLHTPTAKTKDDRPSWEQEPLTVSELLARKTAKQRPLTGINDLYTRQSRSILLLPEDNHSVRFLCYTEGNRLPKLSQRFRHDPMIAVKKVMENGKQEKDKEGDPKVSTLTFTEGKAIWRDLLTLARDKDYEDPQFITYATNLRCELNRDLDEKVVFQPLLVAGVAADTEAGVGKLKLWRNIQTTLPLALGKNIEELLYNNITELVNDAQNLFNEIHELAMEMLKTAMPAKSRDKQSTTDPIKEWLDASPFSTIYFTTAERSLYKSLELLCDSDSIVDPGKDNDESKETSKEVEAKNLWYKALKKAARASWDQLSKSMGTSARALRAYAKFSPKFGKTVKSYDPKFYTNH